MVDDNREEGEKASTPNGIGNDDGEATISAVLAVAAAAVNVTTSRRATARDAGGGRDFEHMLYVFSRINISMRAINVIR